MIGSAIALIPLEPHAAALPAAVDAVGAGCILRSDDRLALRYRIRGERAQLQLPPVGDGRRRDGLWEHTCCEAFISTGAGAYLELNFAPSGDWAVYRFSAYRRRSEDPVMPAPVIRTQHASDGFELEADVDGCARLWNDATSPLRISLTAVIEERGGRRSYWALRHPGERPDFHDADGFTLTIERSAAPVGRGPPADNGIQGRADPSDR